MNADTDCPVISPTGTEADTSTHTSDRKSARPQRIEVITRGERRRRWSLEEKQAIVAESLAPNASLTAVARRHEIGTGLLYAWRHQLLGRRSDEAARFARVDVLSEPHRLSGPVIAATRPAIRPDRDRSAGRSTGACGCAGGRSGAAPRACRAARMIALPPGVRVWLACGRTDMRKGMDGLAMLAQQVLNEDPFSGALFAFRGRGGGLVKLLWYDGQGMCLFSKRLERGHFVWPMTEAGRVSLTPAQLSMLLDHPC